MKLEIRPATVADLPWLERRCWLGGEEEMRARIASQGTCSIIALDAGHPIGQLYIRAYRPGFRSPNGMHAGDWWADLRAIEDRVRLPTRTAVLGCWHVGWVRDADGTDREEPAYRGRGIGMALTDAAVAWLRSGAAPVNTLVAKGTDTDDREYLGYVGGLPAVILEERGFTRTVTFDDPDFLAEADAIPKGPGVKHPARFHLEVLQDPERR